MANDYFQDITPPSDDSARKLIPRPAAPLPPPPAPVSIDAPESDEPNDVPIRVEGSVQPPRGIRNIASSRPVRMRMGADMREVPTPDMMDAAPPLARGRSPRLWMWGAAILGLIIVGGLALFAFRATTVTVTPRSHSIVLTSATSFTAYPAAIAASGTLAYTVQTADLEDSQVVPVSGSTASAPASKASGSITVYNSYSTSPVRLIKNTRFQTSGGLIFRVPADISVPGKKGTTPGSVQVTVVADQAGDQYNVGAGRLTVPGLSSNAAMYAGVYAKSTAAMTGGSAGSSGPGVASADLTAAVSKLQANLLSKAHDTAAAQASADHVVLPDLIQITYTTQPNTLEAGGGARVHVSAHVQIPIFQTTQLGQVVGSAVAADSDNSPVTIVPGSDFAAHVSGAAPDFTAAFQFTLSGTANLIWSVDTAALASALAGRDQGAFQTVITGFSGIQEAHAKIEPFWKNSFPSNPSDIKIIVTPSSAQ